MHRQYSIPITLILLVAFNAHLGGCLENNARPAQLPGTNPTGTGISHSDPQGYAQGNYSLKKILAPDFNQCKGMRTAFDYPVGLSPAKPPANWPSGQGFGSELSLLIVDCNRIGWGPFERPVKMIFETHTNMTPPLGCRMNASYDIIETVSSLWISDPELANWIEENYGAPVQYSSIQTEYLIENGMNKTKWTWGSPTHATSILEAQEIPQQYGRASYAQRFVWANASRLYLLDLVENERITNLHGSAISGELAPPMVYAQTGTTPYNGRGNPLSKIEITAQLLGFSDFACEHPL